MKTLIIYAFFLQNIIFSPNATQNEGQIGDPFIHSVYFWLKDGTSEEEKKVFFDTLDSLKKIKGIKKLYVMTPANTPRDVVDNSYDFALIIHFKNRAAQNTYQDNHIHTEAIKIMGPMIDHFIVYDAIE